MVNVGIALALACALVTNVSLLCKHRGAVAAPDLRLRRPLASAAALFRSRWWAIGFAVAVVAWMLHVGALALAPLSLVETVISGGLVLLAWFAQRWFGVPVGTREWLGLGLCAGGLALLGATGSTSGDHASYSTTAMIAFEAVAVAAGAALLLSGTNGGRPSSGMLLGIAAGLLLGVSNVAIKALTGIVPSDLLAILSPWTLVAALAGFAAFFALARGLQTGSAISVIALCSVASNCAAVVGGVLVFGDSVGADPVAIVVRSLAFVAVIAAAVLMPTPAAAPARA